jgi:serine/threonine protein kinase
MTPDSVSSDENRPVALNAAANAATVASVCPSHDRLDALLSGSISDADRGDVEQHLSECDACCEAFARLTAAQCESWSHLRQLLEEVPTGTGQPVSTLVDVSMLFRAARPSRSCLPGLDGFEMLEEIGRGGMGAIYRARDIELNRVVAVKMLLAGAIAGPERRARFRREAESVARLQHAGLVQLFELGEQDGIPYLVLEFVSGPNLRTAMKQQPPSVAEAVRLIEQVARSVQHAHAQGIVHRDLKPENILLSRDGPKVTDFGLAVFLDAAGTASLTQTGSVSGTPGYMAPEQAAGSAARISPATDIYALGAILYELLTGHQVFRGESPIETLRLISEAEPLPPRRLNPQVPLDLETICLKCLEKQPARRYSTTRELAADLEAFQQHRPIRARRIGAIGLLVRWSKRNRSVALLSVLAAVTLAAGTIASTVLWRHAEFRRNQAEDLAGSLQKESERSNGLLMSAMSAIDELLDQNDFDPFQTRIRQFSTRQRDAFRQAANLYRRLVTSGEDSPDIQYRLFTILRALEAAEQSLGDRDAVRRLRADQMHLAHSLYKHDSAQPRYQYMYGLLIGQQAIRDRRSGNNEKAEQGYLQAVDLLQQAYRARPLERRYAYHLQVNRNNLAVMYSIRAAIQAGF